MAASNIITTGSFQMPDELYPGIWQKVQDGSAIAKLAPQEGFLYGNTDVITFNGVPKAEWVAESGNKSPATTEFGSKTVATHKAQVTVRMTDEVRMWDEQHQINALRTVADSIGVALARALDLGSIHGLNPLTGTAATSITDYLGLTTNSVTATVGDPQADLDAAIAALLVSSYTPDGFALDPQYANTFRTQRNTLGQPLFPEVPLNVKATGYISGLPVAVTDTVSAPEAATATSILGLIGNFEQGFKWGIVRNIPLTLIEFGDPDGLGDLKRKNEVAIRAEAYYAWGVMDTAAFVKVVSGASGATGETA